MELFYRKYGSGPVIIILHGLFGSSDNWLSVAKKLEDICTVILPDLRNHGKSPHSDIHDYESLSYDLYELVTKLQIGKFFLAGHSMGGKTAISFALRWPELLYGLMPIDISPFKGAQDSTGEYKYHRSILETMLAIDPGSITTREEAENLLTEKGYDLRTAGMILKNLHRTGKGFEWKLNARSLLKNLNEIIKPVDRSTAHTLRVTGFPVIFLKGEKSDYLPEEDYADILKIFPAAEFREIENAGHWVHSDNHEGVVKSMRDFIS